MRRLIAYSAERPARKEPVTRPPPAPGATTEPLAPSFPPVAPSIGVAAASPAIFMSSAWRRSPLSETVGSSASGGPSSGGGGPLTPLMNSVHET